ncbi:Hypothetical protein PAS_chr3_0049 [Komagataella phaffii GS115]|uniref:Uncharacterized protein n=1 Tax=Komagataella phaffii (strain GS115 / ATCC 20864) TaxID=644223 RepID=C4R3E2_KOMPG|nr:Hypothetical protein PAS_chr3_0049 [Komagataella phaffii GS115]CAY69977.1 Hypothetical protein PAS_chr3_0049 [Komagataella phaffii GS115]
MPCHRRMMDIRKVIKFSDVGDITMAVCGIHFRCRLFSFNKGIRRQSYSTI